AQITHESPSAPQPSSHSPTQGRGAGVADANFTSAEVEGGAGETRRRMSEARSAEFASPPPRRPPPRAARSEAKGRECRRRPPPRSRGRIAAAPSPQIRSRASCRESQPRKGLLPSAHSPGAGSRLASLLQRRSYSVAPTGL